MHLKRGEDKQRRGMSRGLGVTGRQSSCRRERGLARWIAPSKRGPFPCCGHEALPEVPGKKQHLCGGLEGQVSVQE